MNNNITDKDIKEMNSNYTEAVSTFDFRRVKKVVDVLDWKWAKLGQVGLSIPSIEDMYVVVDRLFDDIVEGLKNKSEFATRNISTCGFTVEVGEDNHVEIRFTVEESEWYSDWEVEEGESLER